MPEQRYKITVAYEGTHYHGWQMQPDTVSIQQVLQETFKKFLRINLQVTGSGRTDAGVHALGQVAHFTTPEPIDTYRFMAAANGLLPKDIRILSIEEVDLDFHARYSAKGKIYHYHLHLDPVMDPFKRHTAIHVKQPFDCEKLKKAVLYFIGTHDFTSFANEPQAGSVAKNPVRTVYRLDIIEEPGGLRLEFEGNGFLYKMIRNIVGTLLDVCQGKTEVEEIPKILHARNRRKAGRAAPAKGLFMIKVLY